MKVDRHAMKLLRDALAVLEHGCPHKGGTTWKMCQRIRRFLEKQAINLKNKERQL